jgi:hypothetical protein
MLNPATNREELHLVAVTDDGHLWHTIASGDLSPSGTFPSWSAFEDVEGQIGDRGEFVRVDASAHASQLQVIGVTRAGRAWHSIRIPSGAWRAPEDVVARASRPVQLPHDVVSVLRPVEDVATGYCNEGVPPHPNSPASDVSQLNVVLIRGGKAQHTVRSANPISWESATQPTAHWKPLTELSGLSGPKFTPNAPSVSERPFPVDGGGDSP